MRPPIVFIFCSLSLLLSTGRCIAQKSAVTTFGIASEAQKPIRLFNGKNLDGWYTFIKDRGRNSDPKSVFMVKDGILRISGEEWGCITTEKEFKNYKLVAEYKWGSRTYGTRATNARDNGLLFHSIGEDGGYEGIWMHSIECNVIEGGTGDLIVVGDKTNRFLITSPVAPQTENDSYKFQPGGDPVNVNFGRVNWLGRDPNWKDEKGFRGMNDVENPVGEWNRLECIVNGDQMSFYLNGTLVNQAIYVRPSKGRIQIQSEGAEIFYRRVDITPLRPVQSYIPEGYRSLFTGKDLTGWKRSVNGKWYTNNREILYDSDIAGKLGYISTVKEYTNFILEFDFKQEMNGNGSIFLRSTIDSTDTTGWKVEVASMDRSSAGTQNGKILKEGEWNHIRIKVQGNEVTAWLNGTQMSHLNDATGKGKKFIALHIRNDGPIKVRLRDLFITEL